MDFYKKLIFTFIIFLFFLAVSVKIIEPVFERQISKIFEGKKISDKLKKELQSSTEDFTQKKEFYKTIIKDIYKKWKPLLDRSIKKANEELANN